LAHFKQIKI